MCNCSQVALSGGGNLQGRSVRPRRLGLGPRAAPEGFFLRECGVGPLGMLGYSPGIRGGICASSPESVPALRRGNPRGGGAGPGLGLVGTRPLAGTRSAGSFVSVFMLVPRQGPCGPCGGSSSDCWSRLLYGLPISGQLILYI